MCDDNCIDYIDQILGCSGFEKKEEQKVYVNRFCYEIHEDVEMAYDVLHLQINQYNKLFKTIISTSDALKKILKGFPKEYLKI